MTTIPYFYIIQHIITKKYYAGSKYSKDDGNPKTLLKTNRPVVLEIRQICKQYNVKLGSGWSVKDDEFLNNKLIELKQQYDC